MRVDRVEIFSDATNAAVMRHPGRRFPGLLVQGDTLYSLCRRADLICQEMGRGSPAFEDANDLRNTLQEYLSHYKAVLTEHEIALQFSETPQQSADVRFGSEAEGLTASRMFSASPLEAELATDIRRGRVWANC
jgi:hypothetical protein